MEDGKGVFVSSAFSDGLDLYRQPEKEINKNIFTNKLIDSRNWKEVRVFMANFSLKYNVNMSFDYVAKERAAPLRRANLTFARVPLNEMDIILPSAEPSWCR